MVKNPPANAGDTRNADSTPRLGRSPGGGNETHSSILVWKIPWSEEPGGLPSVESQRDTIERLGTAQLNTARGHKRGLQ